MLDNLFASLFSKLMDELYKRVAQRPTVSITVTGCSADNPGPSPCLYITLRNRDIAPIYIEHTTIQLSYSQTQTWHSFPLQTASGAGILHNTPHHHIHPDLSAPFRNQRAPIPPRAAAMILYDLGAIRDAMQQQNLPLEPVTLRVQIALQDGRILHSNALTSNAALWPPLQPSTPLRTL